MLKTEELQKAVIDSLRYGSVVYYQIPSGEATTGRIVIRYPFDFLQSDTLLFVVPCYSSIKIDKENNVINRLIIANKGIVNNEPTLITRKVYEIYIEDHDGTMRLADEHDIVANRLLILRVTRTNTNRVIIVNNPIYNDITVSSLEVSGSTLFKQLPTVMDETNNYIKLATEAEILSIEDRLNKLENRIVYGTEEPEEALATYDEGTIYIKVESDLYNDTNIEEEEEAVMDDTLYAMFFSNIRNVDNKYNTLEKIVTAIKDLKQATKLVFEDVACPTTSWIEDTTYEHYPYKGVIALEKVREKDFATVYFSQEQLMSCDYAPFCETKDGKVIIYSTKNDGITIPTILVEVI